MMMIKQRVSGPSLHYKHSSPTHIVLPRILILDQSGVPQMLGYSYRDLDAFISEHQLFADHLLHYELLPWRVEQELTKSEVPQ